MCLESIFEQIIILCTDINRLSIQKEQKQVEKKSFHMLIDSITVLIKLKRLILWILRGDDVTWQPWPASAAPQQPGCRRRSD